MTFLPERKLETVADLAWLTAYFCEKLNWKGYDFESRKDLEVLSTDKIDYSLVCSYNCCHLPRDLDKEFCVLNVNITATGHILTGNWIHRKAQSPLIKRWICIPYHLALETLAVQVELLSMLSGKNPNRFFLSIKIYHRTEQSMSLCGQFKNGFEAGASYIMWSGVYLQRSLD